MGISRSLRRVAGPLGAAVSTKLEDLFRHVTNEARDTRDQVGERIDGVRRETREIRTLMNEVVDPAMTTVAEASTLLQHAALRLERRLADLGAATGAGPGLAGLATDRAAVEVPFALAALERAAGGEMGGGVVVVGRLPLLALLTAGAGRPTTLVHAGPGPLPGVAVVEDEAAWRGPPAPAALVVHALDRPVVPVAVERILAGQAWLGPRGRLVLTAPTGPPGSDADLEAGLALLAAAGWTVACRSAASAGPAGWRPAAVASAGDLVLVELTRAASAG